MTLTDSDCHWDIKSLGMKELKWQCHLGKYDFVEEPKRVCWCVELCRVNLYVDHGKQKILGLLRCVQSFNRIVWDGKEFGDRLLTKTEEPSIFLAVTNWCTAIRINRTRDVLVCSCYNSLASPRRRGEVLWRPRCSISHRDSAASGSASEASFYRQLAWLILLKHDLSDTRSVTQQKLSDIRTESCQLILNVYWVFNRK